MHAQEICFQKITATAHKALETPAKVRSRDTQRILIGGNNLEALAADRTTDAR
jgi:hypothetical protein